MNDITRKFLLKLPKREWDKTSFYDMIIIFNSKHKHSSGYAIMGIAGFYYEQGKGKFELIASACDSINWKLNELPLHNDMLYPSGLIRFFTEDCKFKIGAFLSTIEIELIKE
jgi:hypothetical protein